jgi:hypothetical protein
MQRALDWVRVKDTKLSALSEGGKVENEAVVEEIPAQERKQRSWKEIHGEFMKFESLFGSF